MTRFTRGALALVGLSAFLIGSAAGGEIRVLVWSARSGMDRPGRRTAYPEGLHKTIADALNTDPAIKASAAIDDLSALLPENLSRFRVLVMFMHGEALDEAVQAGIAEMVKAGRLGFVGLHSFMIPRRRPMLCELIGASGGFKWEEGISVEVQIVDAAHPIARGIKPFRIPEDEAYYEPLKLAEDIHVIFRGKIGEKVNRIGWTRVAGEGRTFYFQPGHETYPVYRNSGVQAVLKNAVKWVAGK